MVEHLTADWEVPSWTTVRVPCYYCHYLYGTHKDLSGPSIQTKFDLFVHILTAWVSWGGGRRGQKRLCHISCSSKLRAGAKRFWGVIGHVLKGGQPPTLPPQPFVENSFVTGNIYVPGTVYTQLQTNRQYRYISMCFKFIIFKLRFSYIFRASTCMYCLNCS